jgi:hypothetical protein
VIITGTGRSGTTFLVELLTHLGLDTGFTAETLVSRKNKVARAGLEHDVRGERSPYIVKAPPFCDYAEEVIQRSDIVIEHVFVPMRDLYSAAESRRLVEQSALSSMSFLDRMQAAETQRRLVGGLWRTTSTEPGEQEEVLQQQIYDLLLTLSNAMIPVTFMRYPRIVKDSLYLFEKLSPILGGISYGSFSAVFAKTVCPELIHCFSENDR